MSNGEYNTKNETNSIAIVSCVDINHGMSADHVLHIHTKLIACSHSITSSPHSCLCRDFHAEPVNVMAGNAISYSTIKINLVMPAMRTIH